MEASVRQAELRALSWFVLCRFSPHSIRRKMLSTEARGSVVVQRNVTPKLLGGYEIPRTLSPYSPADGWLLATLVVFGDNKSKDLPPIDQTKFRW